MENYSFRHDFFDTYQSLPDWLKFFWLLVPPLFAFAFTALCMLQRLALKRVKHQLPGNLIYSIHRDEMDMFHVYLRGEEKDLPGSGMDFDTDATICFPDLIRDPGAVESGVRGYSAALPVSWPNCSANLFSRSCAASAMTVPGGKIAAAPALYRAS